MIRYDKFTLDNGLRILVHEDKSTPLTAMNILYDVGSRDEDPEFTGLAHLFEHLMFGGTEQIPEFDKHILIAGGENNAFTNTDITDFYTTLPSVNIETAFWLESDRMNLLDFSQRNLDIQKSVVIEEYNQRYLNQPFGDAMLIMRPLAYRIHPYRWATIGKDISHIRNITLDKIRNFFFTHYAPNNAILTLSGNIKTETALSMAEKWFGKIERRNIVPRNLPAEPRQAEERRLEVEKDVPVDALYKAWHTGQRNGDDFYTLDLITDLLAGGESGRLYTKLVRQMQLFSEINAYITSDIDPGLFIFHGKLMKGVDIQYAEEAVLKVIDELKEKYPTQSEMEKVKNKYESSNVFANTNVLNKAINLSFYDLIGKPELINTEVDLYRKIDRNMVVEACRRYFDQSTCSTLYYKSSRKN
jgi:zinc protease